ncbi:MAG: ribokinase [Clostridia bacterium]|nr:ribokinase [Clostridia bacterium]
MKWLVFGSLNIDRTYHVSHLVRPGETVQASDMQLFAGGKGLNQAIAFARAGIQVQFAGAVGEDGQMLLDALTLNGVDVSLVKRVKGPSGHAVIQVDQNGQNDIVILAGANGCIDESYIDEVLSGFGKGDAVVVQNEISCVPLILQRAHEKGMVTVWNPSPCNAGALACDMSTINYLVVNETEGAFFAGTDDVSGIKSRLRAMYPNTGLLLTLGEEGSFFREAGGKPYHGHVFPVKAVDTTAAGDTFMGYFFASLCRGKRLEDALHIASAAAGISVSRPGASASIPLLNEVEEAVQAAEQG